jgi:paraquat-inducible protein B
VTTQRAEKDQGGGISAIWIIPLLALALGAYMVVYTWMTEGPEITITFNTAEGLVAGKTKVKYRDVDMGLVEEVRLTDDLEKVVAKVKLERQALPMLREDTRFWLVTARIGMGQISGLGTLLSGAYIELSPGAGAEGARDFIALERPPLTPTDAAGLRVKLTSERATSVSAGDKVLYKGYEVGRIESREFDPEKGKVNYVAFVDAPYHELVNSAVRFWNTSGISLTASAEGVKVRTGSLTTILAGGVAFGVPPGVTAGKPVEHNTQFKLYSDYEAILQNPFTYGLNYVVRFDQSVKGLLPGAPVEFRGIPMGRVERIMMEENLQESLVRDMQGEGDPIPVLLYLEPGRLGLPDTPQGVEYLQTGIRTSITNGMRATMQTGNLLTGAKYVGLDFYDGLEPATQGEHFGYTSIPSIASGIGQLEQKLAAVLDKVQELPLETTVDTANAALGNLNQNLASLQKILDSQSTQELPADLEAMLEEIRIVVSGLAPDSDLYQSLNSSLLRLNKSLGNLEALTRTLAAQPNAAVMPSSAKPDPIPEVTQ